MIFRHLNNLQIAFMDYPRFKSQKKRLFNNKIMNTYKIHEHDNFTVKPIVSGSNYPTRPLSKLIDMNLKLSLINKKDYTAR